MFVFDSDLEPVTLYVHCNVLSISPCNSIYLSQFCDYSCVYYYYVQGQREVLIVFQSSSSETTDEQHESQEAGSCDNARSCGSNSGNYVHMIVLLCYDITTIPVLGFPDC